MEREEMRKLAVRVRIAINGRHDDALVDLRARELAKIAEALETPTWFSPEELRFAAAAMDILGYSTADCWTLRRRLDDFERSTTVMNVGSFAAYLQYLPNGGVQ